MYDLDDDNKISRDELLAVLHMMVGANISDEQVRYPTLISNAHLLKGVAHIIFNCLQRPQYYVTKPFAFVSRSLWYSGTIL